jgi:hypothetical protein
VTLWLPAPLFEVRPLFDPTRRLDPAALSTPGRHPAPFAIRVSMVPKRVLLAVRASHRAAGKICSPADFSRTSSPCFRSRARGGQHRACIRTSCSNRNALVHNTRCPQTAHRGRVMTRPAPRAPAASSALEAPEERRIDQPAPAKDPVPRTVRRRFRQPSQRRAVSCVRRPAGSRLFASCPSANLMQAGAKRWERPKRSTTTAR